MNPHALPYFHVDALRERFLEHLEHATARHMLEVDEQDWLKGALRIQAKSKSTIRVDRLSAIAHNAEAFELVASLLIRRATDAGVYLYNPLVGLLKFNTTTEAKSYLIEQLANDSASPLLHFASLHERDLVSRKHIESVQVERLYGPVFEVMMLTINERLDLALGELRQLVLDQPVADSLWEQALAQSNAEREAAAQYCAEQLRHYWNTPNDASVAPSMQLTLLMRERLRHAAIQHLWAAPQESEPLIAWPDGPELEQLTNSDVLDLEPRIAPALALWLRQVLSAQQVNIVASILDDHVKDGYLACRQALNINTRLAPALNKLIGLAQASTENTPEQLAGLQSKAKTGDARLENIEAQLSALAIHIQQQADQAFGLEAVTASSLEQALAAVLDKDLPAAKLLLSNGTEEHQSLSLATWQQLSGTDKVPDAHWQILGPVAAEVPIEMSDLSAALITHCFIRVANGMRRTLTQALLQQQRQCRVYRQHLWQLALDSEVRLEQRKKLLPAPALNLIAALLTVSARPRPTQSWQLTLNQEPCANILLLTHQALSLAEAAAPLILWTSTDGFKVFSSFNDVNTLLLERYPQATKREWVSISEPIAHTLEALDSSQQTEDAQHAFDHVIHRGLPATSLPDLLRCARNLDGLQVQVRRLQRQVRALQVKAGLPDWLKQASLKDQYAYLQVLAGTLLDGSSQQDYLFAIPSISDYAKQRLQTRLNEDFEVGRYKPEYLFVTTTRWIAAPLLPGQIPSGVAAGSIRHRQSLIDFSLNHFRNWDHAITAIELEDGQVIPAKINAEYLHAMVKEMDLGAGYQQLLKQQFDPTHIDYPRRRELFCRQLPGQLLEAAWRAKLSDGLSDAALECVRAVVEQPDAIARAVQHKLPAQLMPLQLIADYGLAPDAIPGVYLFVFAGKDTGPVVMYVPYESNGVFQAFSSLSDLMHQLRVEPALQQLMLARLPQNLRQRYDNGGFKQAHLFDSASFDWGFPLYPQAQVELAQHPVEGNALQFLFEANLRLLQDMAHAQLITSAEVRWETLKSVLGLVFEQLTMFVPGRIGLVLAAWQTELGVLQIINSATFDSWSQTLSELACALLQGLLIGHGLHEQNQMALPANDIEFWHRVGQTPQRRLAAYEAPYQSLEDLNRLEGTNLYADPDHSQYFVLLDGKVYRTDTLDENWHLSSGTEETPGPYLRQGDDSDWHIDPQQPLKVQNGGIFGTLGGARPRKIDYGRNVTVRAAGMNQIEQQMPAHAVRLRESHARTLARVITCLDQLRQASPGNPAGKAARDILCDFFGVSEIDETLLKRVRKPIEKVLSLMLSSKYSPMTSSRYVVASRHGSDAVNAFVLQEDPKQPMVLLDAWFDTTFIDAFSSNPRYDPEEFNAIFRDATLLHEFTHLAWDTYDIRYLQGVIPYPDMLDPGNIRSVLENEHKEAFSHLTPTSNLFR